ncbi:hypothetical protein CW304_15150 [Bacillus sp. UFRGS-B20]|nr:hypothetical protein CW304_15150 [Bacillus sp. UFRGS-B20]
MPTEPQENKTLFKLSDKVFTHSLSMKPFFYQFSFLNLFQSVADTSICFNLFILHFLLPLTLLFIACVLLFIAA